ncbi:MAG TPA: aromatic amino acid transport family protein [Patescibacteria group bacterium]|nr:aromatic amino acid transport family protein [Patescibacteria group bacterium]
MTEKKLISRDEVLAGLGGRPTRQANTTLALIENRTAHLVTQAYVPAGFGLTETAIGSRSQAYLESIAMVREQQARPSIQDIERFASQWAVLAPETPKVRAILANLLSSRYTLSLPNAPGIRMALGLDTEEVKSAYNQIYDEPLATLTIPKITLLDRVRWQWTKIAKRLDALSPTWMAFMFTLVIGGVTLAIPIAAAGIGAIPSIVLIIFFCLVSIVTIAAMAESVTRSGGIRYGNAFIGRVVGDYLGQASSVLLTSVLTAFSFGLLLIFYLGISSTLEVSTTIPAEVWLFVLFGIGLYFLTRGSLNVTVAFTFVIGIVNTILLLVIGFLALSRLDVDYLTYTNLPFLNGEPFNPALYSSIIGVTMGLFSAHMMVAIFGKMILERDPTGKALVRGHPLGIAAAGLINIFWVVAVNGAVPPQELFAETGTALVPLSERLGQPVGLLGAIFVILGMGLGLIHFSIALFNLARERLSTRRAKSLGRLGTFLVSLSPVIVVFAIALWMSITGSGSFAGILGFLGIVVDSLMIGIIPVLLLLASRRKGELVPGIVYRFLGNRGLTAAIILLYLFILLFHGLFIWQSPAAKATGILVALVVIILILNMLRKQAFAPRMVLELRDDLREGEQSLLAVVDGGELAPAQLNLVYIDGNHEMAEANCELVTIPKLDSLSLKLPYSKARELKIWVHRLTAESEVGELPAKVIVATKKGQKEVDLTLASDQAVVPLDGEGPQVTITLQKP